MPTRRSSVRADTTWAAANDTFCQVKENWKSQIAHEQDLRTSGCELVADSGVSKMQCTPSIG